MSRSISKSFFFNDFLKKSGISRDISRISLLEISSEIIQISLHKFIQKFLQELFHCLCLQFLLRYFFKSFRNFSLVFIVNSSTEALRNLVRIFFSKTFLEIPQEFIQDFSSESHLEFFQKRYLKDLSRISPQITSDIVSENFVQKSFLKIYKIIFFQVIWKGISRIFYRDFFTFLDNFCENIRKISVLKFTLKIH